MKKSLTLLVCSLMAIATTSAGNIASGTFSGGGTWTISDKGEFYVDAGTVPEFSGVSYHEPSDEERHIMYVSTGHDARNGIYLTTAPWGQYASKIKTIRLSSSVTKISDGAFSGLTKVEKVFLMPGMRV